MVDILLGTIFNVFPAAAALFANWIAELIAFNNDIITNLFNNSAVTAFFIFVNILGSILFVFGAGFAFGDWAIKARDGSGDTVIDTFKNTFIAFTALLSFSTVPVLLLRFTNEICMQLSKNISMASFASIVSQIQNSTYDVGSDFWSGFALPIYVIIMFVCGKTVFCQYETRRYSHYSNICVPYAPFFDSQRIYRRFLFLVQTSFGNIINLIYTKFSGGIVSGDFFSRQQHPS